MEKMKYNFFAEDDDKSNKKGVKGNKKVRLLQLLKLLQEETDDDRCLGTKEIISYFKAQGLSVNRKTVADDVEMLISSGFDVVVERCQQNMYHMGQREFQLEELKLLVDAVAASKIITVEKTYELIEKLKHLTSKKQAAELEWNNFINERAKPCNNKVYNGIYAITTAIAHKTQVSFRYLEYTPTKDLVYRNEGKVYKNSPYMLLWSDDHYYMVGWSEERQKIVTFRVDRMAQVRELQAVSAVPVPEDFSGADFAQRSFEMMGDDKKCVTVRLECKNELMKHVIDRFGMDVETKTKSKTHFKAKVKVYPSPTFYSWIFRFGGDMKLVGPPQVREDYRKMLQSVLAEHS